MKKKIILIALLGSFFSVLIYFYTQNDEINIVSLGDGLSIGLTPYGIKGYSFNDYLKRDYTNIHKLGSYYEFGSSGKTVKELIYEIKDNITLEFNNKSIDIQRAINEANILTISIGMDELSEDKITKQIITDYEEDMNELLSMIKMLNHHTVIILGIYTINPLEKLNIAKINAYIRDITLSNNFIFIDIADLLTTKDYYLEPKNYYINYLGHKAIYNELKKACKV